MALLGCTWTLAAAFGCTGDAGPASTGDFGTTTGTGGGGGTGGAPPTAWQLDRSKPLSDVAPGFTEAEHPRAPTSSWGALQAPHPTNAFWENVALEAGDQRINTVPYDIKVLGQVLSISRPPLTVQSASITTADVTQIGLSATDAFTGHTIKAFDPLSVTVEWTTGAGGTMTAPLVYGMPYVTARYKSVTPFVQPGQGVAITGVNGETTNPVTGDRFEVSFNNGQTWVLYASPAITLQWFAVGMTADAPYDGTLRAALLPTADAAEVLDAHAAVVPTGGDVEATVDGDNAEVKLVFKTEGDGDLLAMALPHHLDLLKDAKTEALAYRTVTGEARAVSGAAWTLSYPLSPINWDAVAPIDPARRADVEAALEADKAFEPDATAVDENPYFGGKQLAKLARLIQIAEALGKQDIAAELRERLKPLLTAWLDGTNSNPLVYDKTWGGVVTTNGLADPGADFGQGYYNDHHFHYGYFLYAAAVLAKGDAAWRTDYADKVLWLVRDIANPSDKDPSFPAFRHMDWFTGHSWAAGLFSFGDNRNQESTAEAVNAWYGMKLFGSSVGNLDVENLGRVLLALETTSAQKYWQITDQSAVYDAPFKDNHVVGVLWSTKADFTTFFGANPEYIYGIQMIPITPISESLLSPAWITDAWPQMEAAATEAAPSWQGLLYSAHAIIDKDKGWAELNALTEFDDGNSKTATLYWAATRH